MEELETARRTDAVPHPNTVSAVVGTGSDEPDQKLPRYCRVDDLRTLRRSPCREVDSDPRPQSETSRIRGQCYRLFSESQGSRRYRAPNRSGLMADSEFLLDCRTGISDPQFD